MAVVISNTNVDQVMNRFSNSFSSLYNEYKYTGISKGQYLTIVKNLILSEPNTFDNNSSYEEYILGKIKTQMDDIILQTLYDDAKAFNVLNNYINEKFCYTNNYEAASKCIYKFSDFLETYQYCISSDILLKLIKENNNFSNTINEIVKQKLYFIQHDGISNLFNDINVQEMVKTYCIHNNIEIKNKDGRDPYFDDAYRTFRAQINQFPLLTVEQEKELLCKAKNGDLEARNSLVNSNMRFVDKVARGYCNRGVSLIDLMQEGSIGVIDAIESFDISKNTRFLTYAYFHIRNRITKLIYRNSRNIRLPWRVYGRLNRYRDAVNELIEKLKRNPTIEEIADYMNVPIDDINELMLLQDDTISIHSIVGEDSELGDFIDDKSISIEEDYISGTLSDEINKILESGILDDREKQIIKLRFGFEDDRMWTLQEIGDIYGISRERVRQIEGRILKRLKYSFACRSLVDYTDNPDEVIRTIEGRRKKK